MTVELEIRNGILYCAFEDNGVGRERAGELKTKTAENKKSLGLKITTERLALLNREKDFSAFYDIEDLKNEQGDATGTRVSIKIKVRETAEELV